MATLLSTIARRCIDEYESMALSNFYADSAMPTWGYCSDRMQGVLFEEALSRKPATMGRCIGEAKQDPDLKLAFMHMKLSEVRQTNALAHLEYLFMVVLAHEIKALLLADQVAAITSSARS